MSATPQAIGLLKATNGAATVQWPVHQTGDIGLLWVQTANEAITLASAQGFQEIVQVGTGTAGAAGSVRLGLFWCRATSGSMMSPQVADPGGQVLARIQTFRNCALSGNPWDAFNSGVQASTNTAVSIPGITTTTAAELVVLGLANAIDTTVDNQVSGWTNAALTGIVEQMDWNADAGQGGGIATTTATKTAAGATGATTATLATASKQAFISIGLKPAVTVSALPVFQAAGTPVHGTGTVQPVWPTHQADDIALLIVTSANQTISLSTPAGFVEVADSPQGTGTAGTVSAVRLAVYWCRATSSGMAAPVVADPGNHVTATILTFRGCETSGNPWDVTAGDVTAVETATVQIPGDTTTGDNRLVVVVSADSRPVTSLQYSGWTNDDLTGLVEIADFHTTDGNGSGFGAACGAMETAGAFGPTTASIASSNDAVQAHIAIALKPPAAGGGGGGGGDASLPHRYWRMRLKNTPGAGPKVNQVELVERVGTVAAPGMVIAEPSQMHPGVTHIRPMFRVNQGGDTNAVLDIDVSLMTVPAGYSPDIPTDQVTRRVDTFFDQDGVLLPGVGQNDGASSLPLVKGLIRGRARHGDQIIFSDVGRVFQTVPQVTLHGGINHQPASVWGSAAAVDAGTASSAPNAAKAQYEDFGAADLTESGFTCKARLRQKATITQQFLNFAGTHLNTNGETDTISTLTSAPSVDDGYYVQTQMFCRLRSKNGTLFRVQMKVALETTIDSGATWQQRATGVMVFENSSLLYELKQVSYDYAVIIKGLTSDGTDRMRLRLIDVAPYGLGDYDTSQTYAVGSTLGFINSTDVFASKTPATDDFVTWEAVGYV